MLKIGVIGVGYFGEIHIKVLLKLQELFDVVGFFDIKENRCKEISKKYNLKNFSLDELIQASDVLDIASETKSHFELIKLILNHKKHIFIEKPICENTNQIRKIKKLHNPKKTHLQIGFIERFNPAFSSISSIPFKAKHIKAFRSTSLSERNKKNSIIQDLMIHDIDIINNIVNGYPIKILVEKNRKNSVSCKITFNNNCTAQLYSERTNAKNKKLKRKMIIKTEKEEEIIIDFLKKETSIKKNKKTLFLECKKTNQLEEELKYLYDCITNKKENEISVKAGLECGVIAEKIIQKIA